MRTWIRQFFRGVPASFSSQLSVDECVQRLARRVHPTVFSVFDREFVVGKVRRDRVYLHHVRPFFGNSFKPVFLGRFIETANGTIFEGRFIPPLYARIAMTAWFVFLVCWVLLAIVMALLHIFATPPEEAEPMWKLIAMPLAGIGFFFVGVGFVRLAWNISAGDIDYLTRFIEESLAD